MASLGIDVRYKENHLLWSVSVGNIYEILHGFYLSLQEMEKLIADLEASGISRERIDRARRRGTAYQCRWCYNLDGKKTVTIRCRLEDHITKTHLDKEEMPFRCLLCGYVSTTFLKLESHTRENTKHVLLAAKKNVLDHRPFLWVNPSPHVFGPQDYLAFNQEASLLHFLGVMGSETDKEGHRDETQGSGLADKQLDRQWSNVGLRGEKVALPATDLPGSQQPVPTATFPAAASAPQYDPTPVTGQPPVPMPTSGPLLTSSLPLGMTVPSLQQRDPMWPVMSVAPHLSPLMTSTPLAVATPDNFLTNTMSPSIGQQLSALISQVIGTSSFGAQGLGQPLQMNVALPNLQSVTSQVDPQLVSLIVEKETREAVDDSLGGQGLEQWALTEVTSDTGVNVADATGLSVTVPNVEMTEEREEGELDDETEVDGTTDGQEHADDGAGLDGQAEVDRSTEVREPAGDKDEAKLKGQTGHTDGDNTREPQGQADVEHAGSSAEVETREAEEKEKKGSGEREETINKVTGTEAVEDGNAFHEDDVLSLQDEDMTISTGKREKETDAATDREEESRDKKPKCGLEVDVVDLSNRTMLEIVERSLKSNDKSMGLSERNLKAMIDQTCAISKFTEALNKLTRTLENDDKEERRREEKRIEMEERREEEWRKALIRLQDEEHRWENRRRDLEAKERERQREEKREWDEKREREERKEREERRKQVEQRSERNPEERESQEKENDNRPRSLIGRKYSRNTITDVSNYRSGQDRK